MNIAINLTRIVKSEGPLTKRISLDDAGNVFADGSACVMSEGSAQRVSLGSVHELADLIAGLGSHEALALGSLRPGLAPHVKIVTKHKLEKLNGAAPPDIISRTAAHITFLPDRPALALLDFDTKGMPPEVSARLDDAGGFWATISSVVPSIADSARVLRRSTSAGLYRTDTGERLPGSNGAHAYVVVRDGADIERFLRTLHARCWLAGFGWMMVGAGGQLLERSIVDRMVGAPERLIFEGAPVLDSPVAQDAAKRHPIARGGGLLDTISACPPLTILEQARIKELRAREHHRLAPESARVRDEFVTTQAQKIAARTGASLERAASIAARQSVGVLLPDVVLPFDDPALAGLTVGDVLADPARFEGATLADPLEGVGYGACKAKVMRRADGAPWIHSFAHGRTVYALRHDAQAIEAAVEKAPRDKVADTFVRMALDGDMAEEDAERIRNTAADRAGVGRRLLAAKLKGAAQQQAQQRHQEDRQRAAAERRDPRPEIQAPLPDAPWLPQMQLLNEVLGASPALEPPMRDLEGVVTQVRVRVIPHLHTLTTRGVNEAGAEETRLPTPAQPLLTKLDRAQLAELIERHIEFVDEKGRGVHLNTSFVDHFLVRHDGALPVVTAVATLPLVLPDGGILNGHGLVRERGIVFRIPGELQALLPDPEQCTPLAAARAMQFLTDAWLCDVAADYAGKCILIAAAATVLERLLLPERPVFFITAGQRGGGKTTAVNMIATAVLGTRAPAAAWSVNDEERRKALFAYLAEGVPLLCWDNIPRGAAISCPTIEKALTAETYSDRVLGASESRTVPATTIQFITGNNVSPRGDMASRSLCARLAVERPDPENREFRHPDPLAWTEANRGAVLAAIYTILLANPRLQMVNPPAAATRFKTWWHLVGAAIEHAAAEHLKWTEDQERALVIDLGQPGRPSPISFKDLFLAGEAEDEQTNSLVTVVEVIRQHWPAGATSQEIAAYAGAADDGSVAFKGALEAASGKAIKVTTPTVIAWRLKALVEAPVKVGGKTLTLHYRAHHQANVFKVREST